MSYQYSRLQSEAHRDIAHWRGARRGMRVLSLPTCHAWLQRQANDACYDFWPDLVIGSALKGRTKAQHDTTPLITYLMQKDTDGAWFIDAWEEQQGVLARQQAANADTRDRRTVSRSAYQTASIGLQNVSPEAAGTAPPLGGVQAETATSFIIEIGSRLN